MISRPDICTFIRSWHFERSHCKPGRAWLSDPRRAGSSRPTPEVCGNEAMSWSLSEADRFHCLWPEIFRAAGAGPTAVGRPPRPNPHQHILIKHDFKAILLTGTIPPGYKNTAGNARSAGRPPPRRGPGGQGGGGAGRSRRNASHGGAGRKGGGIRDSPILAKGHRAKIK